MACAVLHVEVVVARCAVQLQRGPQTVRADRTLADSRSCVIEVQQSLRQQVVRVRIDKTRELSNSWEMLGD